MSQLSLETLKDKKTPGQLVAGWFHSRSDRKWDIEHNWQGFAMLGIGFVGFFAGPIIAGTLMFDVPADSELTGMQALASAPFFLAGPAVAATLGYGYVFGPEVLGTFGVHKGAKSFDDLSWFMKRRVVKLMAEEDEAIGWRPRNGLPHIKGQTNTHDRFRTRMIVDETNAVATLFIQHWEYDNRSQLWRIGNDIQSKDFSSKETHLIHEYYEQLHAEADRLEQQAEVDLEAARNHDIIETAQLEQKLLDDAVIKEKREKERQETVAHLLAMSAVLDNQ